MDFLPQRTFTDFNFKINKRNNKLKLPRIDTAYISYYDYERIRKNAMVPKPEETLHDTLIEKQQETIKKAKANTLKEKIKGINVPQYLQKRLPNNNFQENDLMSEAKKNKR